jgi:hypothetical protein
MMNSSALGLVDFGFTLYVYQASQAETMDHLPFWVLPEILGAP